MGKNLKGKECGKGISQRKDGFFQARFVDQQGRRCTKYFKTLPEARNWLEDARYHDKHGESFEGFDQTVDEWFEYWTANIIADLAPNTIRNYKERYIHNIQPIIRHMKLTDVKPMHCKKVLLEMYPNYAGSTIKQTFITMGAFF